jgi:predicted RND superfamily exporter protein
VDDNGSDRLVNLGDRIELWWRDNGVADFSVETTGLMYEFGRSEERIAYGQVAGLAIALLSIGAVLLAILRVPKNALIALIPNGVPLVITFGLMGFLKVPLDAATVCLGSLALGIAVDDTIHLMTGYTERRNSGKSPAIALDQCLEHVLPALAFTTAAVVAGFAVLALSQFTLIRNLGLVTSGLVFLCLLADLTLLPPLLLSIDRKR